LNHYCHKWTAGGKERHQASQLPVTAQRLHHADLIINQKHQLLLLHHKELDQLAGLQHQEFVIIHDHQQKECQVTSNEICGPSLNSKYSIVWVDFVVGS